jgi:hypothetical protein
MFTEIILKTKEIHIFANHCYNPQKNIPMKNCPNCHEEMEDNFDVC